MQTFILPIALIVLMSNIGTPRAQALFGQVAAERERRQDAEQRIVQERQNSGQLARTNGRLHVIIGVLSAGVTVTLVFGAAIGSKTRRDAKQP